MKYVARGVPAAEAEAEVLALWQRLGADEVARTQGRATFRWGWVDHPAHCFLLEGDGQVVGVVGIGERTLVAGGRTLSAGLLGGFIVEKQHRTFFPALILQKAVLAWARKNVDVIYGFPNESSAPIMKKLGFRDFARLDRWVLVLRHARYLERVMPPLVARALAVPVDRLKRFERRPRRGRELRKVQVIDERFALPGFSNLAHGKRDAAFVKWRFADRPDERASIHALSERGEILGYAAVHVDRGTAHVRDVRGRDVESMGQVLRHLSRRLPEAASLSFLCSAPPELERELMDIGFRIRPPARILIGFLGDSIAQDPDVAKALSRWYATEADEDQ